MAKLNYLGIGPKIGILTIPLLAGTIVYSVHHNDDFKYFSDNTKILLITGIIILLISFFFYFNTLKLLLSGIKETKLITSGLFKISQNPLYFLFITIIIPAISLIVNSWLILVSSVVAYILFKVYIDSEYNELENVFGEEYNKYRRRTPEFFPIIRKK